MKYVWVCALLASACYRVDYSASDLKVCSSSNSCTKNEECLNGYCVIIEGADAGAVQTDVSVQDALPHDAGAAIDATIVTDTGLQNDSGALVDAGTIQGCTDQTGVVAVKSYSSGTRSVVHCQDGVGPSAHWTFDEDLTEQSGNQALTATGSHQLTDGILGRAVHSINGGLTVQRNTALDITTDTGGTVTAWVRFPDPIGVNEGLVSRFNSGAANIEQCNYAMLFDRNQLRMMGNGRNEAPRYEWAADTQWHFFAYVFDGTRSKYFIDGAQLNAPFTVDRSNFPGSPLNMVIGQGPNSEAFNGQIDDLAIYQRVLNAESIAGLYRGFQTE